MKQFVITFLVMWMAAGWTLFCVEYSRIRRIKRRKKLIAAKLAQRWN
jgi:hypothetical protein